MDEADQEGEIARLESLRVSALLRADTSALDSMTSEKYVHVESNGLKRSKKEFLAGLAAAEFRFDSFVIDRNLIEVLGNCAIVHGTYHNVVRTRSGPRPVKYARHVRIYAREAGVWRNILHQATEIVPTEPSPPPF